MDGGYNKTMKAKSLILSTLALALLLGSCSVSSENMQKDLEAEGYQVTLVDAKDYRANSILKDITEPFDFATYLEATKDNKDALFAWFFFSIRDAEDWYRFSGPWLDGIEYGEETMKSGQKNNCIYLGTANARSVSKLDRFF